MSCHRPMATHSKQPFVQSGGSPTPRGRIAGWTARLILLSSFPLNAIEPCRIEVVEQGSGWPVSLVELRTTHQARFITDNAGVIAFDSPELMGRETWFDVLGQGYQVPKDGLGFRGVRLRPEPGKRLRVEVKRTIISKRMGRLTGGGLFAEAQKLGEFPEWRDGPILGSDSVQNAVYHGRLFWLWGDTTLARYPLGLFDSSCGTTDLHPLVSLKPPVQLVFDYFKDAAGAARGVAHLGGEGPTWITGVTTLRDAAGREHFVGSYLKIHPPLDAYQRGLCAWNDASSSFEVVRVLWTQSESSPKPGLQPEGHPVFWKDPQSREWILFGNPMPTLRFPATFEAWSDPTRWELLQPQETLASAKDGNAVKPHSGSIAWNAYRKRWVTVFMQVFGSPSAFGELWYAEADSPLGPWGTAVKVLSHDNYTFYNPTLHPEFTPEGSPILFFEGTYTLQFADKPMPTARYDYNQILYRLDLDDAALAPARQ